MTSASPSSSWLVGRKELMTEEWKVVFIFWSMG
jgi:hypothetical protein